MSYILDALRKADAERDRGNVPGIHAQPSFGGAAPAGPPPAAKPALWLAVGAVALLLAAALAWYLTSAPRDAVRSAAAVPTPASAVPAAVAPPVEVARTPPEQIPVIRQTKPPAPRPQDRAPANPAETRKAPGTGEKVYTPAELPDDIRRQLPALTVGGSMYSTKPADRILILNGQVLHEGDKIAPDLTLQQIRLKAAVLNFKGYRYTIAF